MVWPHAVTTTQPASFDFAVLYGTGNAQERMAQQFVKANVTPSELYVMSLPGTAIYRLRADQSGFANLVLAGDWIDNEFMNAGFIEGSVVSGLRAADAVRDLGAQPPIEPCMRQIYAGDHGRAG